jgi:acetyltransferase-like isoleucine patch superfamily enzyme
MLKALKEIGIRKAIKFLLFEIALLFFKLIILPQARAVYLRMLGAKIGKDVIIHDVRFFNCYRKGFRGLKIGDNCFIGNDCLLDLADNIILERNVTLSASVNIITHLNVGYEDHPLQVKFPSMSKGVVIKENVFVGASTTVLPGVTINGGSFVGASALVNKDVEKNTLVGGVPAVIIKKI